MKKEDVYSFLNENPFFYLATEEKGQPHVRVIRLYNASESGIIFNIGKHKDVFKELEANPKVELCFYNNNDSVQVRLQGEVEFLEDMELKMSIVDNHTYLKPWVEEEGFDMLAVCSIKNGIASVWTDDDEPKTTTQL